MVTRYPNHFKIIVSGSRDFEDYALVKKVLDKAISKSRPALIVSGGARGADRLGERYARENRIPLLIVKAEWDAFGKRAGYLRNKKMANYADGLVAFWDGESKGTKHMIDIAAELNMLTTIVNVPRKRLPDSEGVDKGEPVLTYEEVSRNRARRKAVQKSFQER